MTRLSSGEEIKRLRLERKLQRLLRKLEDRVLLRPPDQDHPTRDGESAFSRNSKRHPHW